LPKIMYCFCAAGMPIPAILAISEDVIGARGKTAAVDFSGTCGKMMLDSREGLDEAGRFESYLRKRNGVTPLLRRV